MYRQKKERPKKDLKQQLLSHYGEHIYTFHGFGLEYENHHYLSKYDCQKRK